MRKNWIGIGLMMAVGLNLSIVAGFAQGTHPTREFMRQKLSYTQGIVEGLVTEKHYLVLTNGTALRSMNLTNAFFTLRNPDYLKNIKNFQAKVDDLLLAAVEKDLEKSTKAYSQVVDSCVACHKTFRIEQFRQGQ
jgi:hypothetical protein